ncbi:toxin-antitoxin system YwqK family antitoxin [Flavobacterium pallidum]|uniref:Uncharacterized protein n=1 Tax=Flavobacterium pallidum TaxID=2172098 RepID=A0A2S1SHZ0_9FLAO|nr:toxin-antitoxin system YwqK family antitoxin [Flavobacterium pallidum]AWI26028.1 hypothetical protein HYN49_09035 [Flavobacterium pallidum]
MKHWLLLLAVSLISPAYCQTDYTFIYDNEAIIEKGNVLHDDQKYEAAIAEYDRIVSYDPLFLKAQYEKALTLSAMKKYVEEAALLSGLYQKGSFPDMPMLYIAYGNLLSEQKKFEESEKIYIEAEKTIPDSPSLLYNFAVMYIRWEKQQQAVEYLEKTINISPYHSNSHYILGLLAYENGKIVEGSLAMITYLILDPGGIHAGDAVLKLNQKYGQNFLEKPRVTFSKSGDHFEELETILRNQLPLNKAYKIQSDIDDVLTRQVQAIAEYVSQDHKMGDGFFENTYIPWIKDMVAKKQFEAYTYYMLQSKKDNLGKKITSKKKMIEDFSRNYIGNDFWAVFSKRKMEHFGKMQTVNIAYKDRFPFTIGAFIDGKNEGPYKMVNHEGIVIGELNLKNGELDGIQKYYSKGKLTKETTQIQGRRNGIEKEYYPNGNLSVVANYKDDQYDGLATTYHLNGGKQCEVSYKNGDIDGTTTCYYPNGTKKSTANYSNGQLNGVYAYYNEAGDLTETGNYKNGELDGQYAEYYDGRIIKAETAYINGKAQGTYKSYYENKSPKRVVEYDGVKLKLVTDYYQNGNRQSVNHYNSKGDLETIDYFDVDGNLYLQDKFKSDNFKSSLQFTKANPKPVEINSDKKTFTIKNFNGNIRSSGGYEKNMKQNEWRYNYNNGNIKCIENFKNGLVQGLVYNYDENGNKTSVVNYVNDTINGLYEVYKDGILKRTLTYKNGKATGPQLGFYNDGKMATTRFYENDELNDEGYDYWQSGKFSTKIKYHNGEAMSIDFFDPSGTRQYTLDYKNATGTIHYRRSDNLDVSTTLINGALNGLNITKDKSGKTTYESEYINNVRHKKAIMYGPLNLPLYEITFYCGKENGMARYYDLAGNLRLANDYAFGEDNGTITRYYHNKQKQYEHQSLNGVKDGPLTYFNQKGEPLLILGYVNDELEYYIRRGKTGQLDEKVVIENGTADIVSNYANGKTAARLGFEKGALNNKYQIFGEDGKLQIEAMYDKGLLQGSRTEYFSNGNVYKKESFKNNDYEGIQEYYTEDGKLRLKAAYQNDELHGNTEIYENGKLSVTKKYDSDELIDIIK